MVQDFSLPTLYFPLQNSISPISPFLSSVPFQPGDTTGMASLGLWLGPKSPKISFFTTFLFFHRISTKIEKSCSFSTCNCTVRKCTFEQTFRGVDSTLERNGPISDENKCWHHIREKKNYEKCFLRVSDNFDAERTSGIRVFAKIYQISI